MAYLVITLSFPVIWLVAVALARAYDSPFCGIGEDLQTEVAGVPAFSGIEETAKTVGRLAADTIAALARPEPNGARLRELAWELGEQGTQVNVAPALRNELPQLFSALLCDVSLVGLPPALPVETAEYALHMLRRLAVKPDITGLRQVSGRSDLSIEDSIRLGLMAKRLTYGETSYYQSAQKVRLSQ